MLNRNLAFRCPLVQLQPGRNLLQGSILRGNRERFAGCGTGLGKSFHADQRLDPNSVRRHDPIAEIDGSFGVFEHSSKRPE